MKELEWIGSSKKDLLEFPSDVRKESGHALYVAQKGGKYQKTKPLKGFGSANVQEVVLNNANGTFRVMYTVQFEEVIYVLHAFQKKSKSGIKTPKSDMKMLEQRLKQAHELYQIRLSQGKK